MKTLILSFVALLIFYTGLGQSYNYYYGNIHAHTGLSDGSKDSVTSGISQPGPAYFYASQSYNFDFLGISEHNHATAGMQLVDYARGLYQADTANHTGQFVTMFGMEYGVISTGGHVVIYGIDSLVGWESNNYKIYCAQADYAFLWKLIARRPKAFATVAHPNDTDFGDIANNPIIDTADIALVGAPMRSGAAFSTTKDYTDPPPATVYDSYWRKLLSRGYHVGATIDHDNHYTTFGRTADSRTVVLANELSRDSIMDAYRKMRFYASDDWNTHVNFTINAYPVGSVFSSSVDPTINIQVTDPDVGDVVSTIQLYYGVPGSGTLSTLLTSNTNSATLSYTHNINIGNKYYYYAIITQADGQKIWTSPIWVTQTAFVIPIQLLNFDAAVVNNNIRLQANFLDGSNYNKVVLEKGYKGYDFKAIKAFDHAMAGTNSINTVDSNATEGYQYYRLQFTDISGEVSYSKTLAVMFHSDLYDVKTLAAGAKNIKLQIKSVGNSSAVITIYNMEGRMVSSENIQTAAGVNSFTTSTNFNSGIYIVVVRFANGIVREGKAMVN
ncbi:hypothetical protein BH09BAC2_BH09BAC2_04220 [soil metagenome]